MFEFIVGIGSLAALLYWYAYKRGAKQINDHEENNYFI